MNTSQIKAGIFTVADDRRSIERIDPTSANDGILFILDSGKCFIVYADNERNALVIENYNQEILSRID